MATNELDSDVAYDFESIEISDPYMFATVFSNPDLSRELLEIILGVGIERVEIIGVERAIIPELGAKSIRMDVYVADGKGTKYNVEMQNVNKYDLERRSRYYLSANDIDCIRKGVPYKNLNDSYVIFVCKFDPFNRDLPIYTVTPHCKETGDEMPDGSTRLFLNSTAWEHCENPRLRAFLRYVDEGMIDGGDADDDFPRKVDEAVRTFRRQKEWRTEYMKIMNELNERYAEGMEKGMEKGAWRVQEENRLLGERLEADGRESEAIKVFADAGLRARELERYGIRVPDSPGAPAR